MISNYLTLSLVIMFLVSRFQFKRNKSVLLDNYIGSSIKDFKNQARELESHITKKLKKIEVIEQNLRQEREIARKRLETDSDSMSDIDKDG